MLVQRILKIGLAVITPCWRNRYHSCNRTPGDCSVKSLTPRSHHAPLQAGLMAAVDKALRKDWRRTALRAYSLKAQRRYVRVILRREMQLRNQLLQTR